MAFWTITPMISSTAEITKDWLEAVLQAQIAHVTVRKNPAFNSLVTHLDVTYSHDVNLPRQLLVKLNKEHDGQNEIQFYRSAEGMNLPMIPRHLGMNFDLQSGLSFLILEDMSETHRAPVTRQQLQMLHGVPTNEHMESIVDCIAQFHAAFWQHSQLGTIPDTTEMRWWYRNEEFHTKHVERRKAEWAKFVDMYEDETPREWLTLGEFALEMLPKLFKNHIRPRLSSKLSLTMSHGDCYLPQFLVPKVGSGKSYLIDFQDTCVNFPAYDLVYMFATFWTHEQRTSHEVSLLRRYQNGLQRHGVQYDWSMLQNDYRLSLSYMLFDAVWNATSGSSREYWKPKMNCLVDAYQDWKCADL
jgi:thiamine kinase-like enzyme